MMLRFRYSFLSKALSVAALLGTGALLEGCRHESVVPTPAVDYYPLEVGTYRTYAVSDTVWSKGVATPANYQFREAVTEKFTDAAGQTAYRVLRARRVSSNQAWSDDSVLVVQQQVQSILMTRDNVRTIELIYPVRAGKTWKKYAFTTERADSVRAFDANVEQPFTTPGATPKTYATTVIARDQQPIEANDGLLRRGGNLQVFAQGVGPVLRRRYAYETFYTTSNGASVITPAVIQVGRSRLEVLIDSGKL
ncbi:hypothetical protein FNT36_01065 [Hymenobacter setariae]|uniref:DUF3108 domain-containing protein n=1 Tax=Hymenobacter setariae TaxID=2594794 RepID=A0A558C1Q1_9BACT|nr:hypothetical protein [Hymenobacter setariae]TVT42715.1 hypothetical protein FNT36_01065 [Hymenobacter setariae]